MRHSTPYLMIIGAVLVAGFLFSYGQSIHGAVTIEPGKDPVTAARHACDPSLRPYSSMNTNTINRYLCCESACRSFCARDIQCITKCIPRCTP